MAPDMAPNHTLTSRQESILSYIADTLRERGFPPSVREIGEAVGLTSPSTVHSHLATLQKHGFLRRDPDNLALSKFGTTLDRAKWPTKQQSPTCRSSAT